MRFDGRPGQGVTAKDLVLHALGRFGIAVGTAMPSNIRCRDPGAAVEARADHLQLVH